MKRMKETIGRLAAGSLRWAALAIAIGLTGSAWAGLPTITVSGNDVTISTDSSSHGDIATNNGGSDTLTIPAATDLDLASGTILRIKSISFGPRTSGAAAPASVVLAGVSSAAAEVTKSGYSDRDKYTYVFTTPCLMKVGTGSTISFRNSAGEQANVGLAASLTGSTAQDDYLFSTLKATSGNNRWSVLTEIVAEKVTGYVGSTSSNGQSDWGFQTGSGSGKVYLSGYGNYMKTDDQSGYANDKEIVLVNGAYDYAFNVVNGNSFRSDAKRYSVWKKISGDGTLTANATGSGITPAIKIYDVSEFAGTINACTSSSSIQLFVIFCGAEESIDNDSLFSKLYNNYKGSFYVSPARTSANGNVVTVPAGKTWKANKFLNEGETVIDGTFDGAVVNSGTLTINGTVTGNITNTGTVNVNAGASFDFGAARDLSTTSTWTIDPGATIYVTMTNEEYGKGSISVTGVASIPAITVLDPTGATIGTITPAGESTATLDTGVKISGAATDLDLTCTNTIDFAYSSFDGASTWRDNAPVFTDDGVYARASVYTTGNGAKNFIANNSEHLTLAVVGQMSPTANTIFLSLGNTTKENPSAGAGLILVRTDSEDEVLVGYIEGRAVKEITRMTVPNSATARHVYIITKEDDNTQNKTTFTVYLDGIKWKSATITKLVLPAGGVQVGADFGGGVRDYEQANGETYITIPDNESETGVLNAMRIYGRIITPAEIAAYSEAYPYTSPNGSSSRTFDADGSWIETETTPWATKLGEVMSDEGAPLHGSALTLTVANDPEISVNLDENAVYEALTLTGDSATFDLAAGKTGAIRVTGAITIGAVTAIKNGALKVEGPITLIEGGSLDFNYADYDVSGISHTTDIILANGLDEPDGVTVKCTPPSNQYKGYDVEYRAGSKDYVLTITPKAATLIHSGSDDVVYDTVAEALEDAVAGDTVQINNNVTVDSLTIDKAVTLKLAATYGTEKPFNLTVTTLNVSANLTVTGTGTLSASAVTVSGDATITGYDLANATVTVTSGSLIAASAPSYMLGTDTVVDTGYTTGVKFINVAQAVASVTTGGTTNYYTDIQAAVIAMLATTGETDTLELLNDTALDPMYQTAFTGNGFYYDGSATVTKAVATYNNRTYGSLATAVAAANEAGTTAAVTLKRASSEAVSLNVDVTVTEASVGLYTGTLSGVGTLVLAGTRESTLNFNNWTGTVVLPAVTASTYLSNNGFNFNFYGITGSTVRLSEGLSGQWLTSAAVNPAVEIPADKTFTLGSFSPSFANTFAVLKGEGAFVITAEANGDNDLANVANWGASQNYSAYFRLGDVSAFTGLLTTTSDVGIALGSSKPGKNTVGGKIYVYTTVTASDDWTAPNGIVLADANATLTVGAGATVTTDPAVSTTVADSYVEEANGVYSVETYKTVTFFDEDGETVLQTASNYKLGDTVTAPADPTKTATAQYTYTFTGWDDGTTQYGPTDALPDVTGNVTYTATYSSTVNEYTITWVVDETSDTTQVAYGTVPTYTDPVKQYYTFTGWDPTPVGVTGTATYTATFSRNTVTVTVPSVDNATVSVHYTTGGAAATGTAADTYTIDQGTTVTVTYTADTGYFINGQASNTVVLDTVTTSTEITSQQAGSTSAAEAQGSNNEYYSSLSAGLGWLYSNLSTPDVYLQVLPAGEASASNTLGGMGIGYDATNKVYAKAVAIVGEAGYLTVQEAVDAAAETSATVTLKADNDEGLTLANNKTVTIIATVGNVTYDYVAPVPVTAGAYTIDVTPTETGATYTARDWYSWTVTVEADNAEVTGFTSPVSEASPDITFTVTAAATYKVTSVQVNGAEVGTTAGEYNATLTGNTTITVTTELDVVTFTVPALANATVTQVTGATATGNANEYTATIGAEVVVTYTANDGYVFAGGATTTTVNWTAAAAEAPVAPASAPVVAVAKIGNTPYETLAAAIGAAQAGDTVALIADCTADAAKTTAADRLVVTKAITIDFGAYTYSVPGSLEPTANWCAIYIDANTTVTGTTGGVDCLDKEDPSDKCGVYAFNVREGAKLTIAGGHYHGGGTIVQAQLGTVEITGGTFTVTPFDAPYGSDFAFNCVDASYQAGDAGFSISGGTFVGFDPQDNKSEGAGTDYTADGFVAIDDGEGTFTVVEGYNVTYKNGDTVLETYRVAKAEPATPAYAGETPVKPADELYTYTFAGWDPAVAETVTEDATYAATFTPVAKYTTFTVAVPANTTVTVTGATLVEGNTYRADAGAEVTITYAASGAYVASGTKTQKVTPTANQTVEPPSTYTVVPATVEFTNPSSVVTYYTESNLGTLNNGTYKLLADVTRTQRMAFGNWASSVTIDLNGFTLTSTASDCAITLGRAGTAAAPKVFNLVDTSAEKGGVLAFTTTPSSTTSAIRTTTTAKYNQVTIGEGVTVTGGCILMSGANQTLTVYGTVNGGEDFAIASQGDSTKDLTLTVAAGAVVSSSTTAVYLPGTGTATIAGTVTGATGVEIRSGTLNVVDGAVITATGAFSEAANGSGTTVVGAAVAVSQHTTKNPISITVSGGTLTGAKALYETDVQNGEGTTGVAMAVTGGTFVGAVESDDVTGFISGGTFDAEVSPAYCAAGYEPKDNGNGTYGVQTANVEVEVDEVPTTTDPVTVLVAVPKDCTAATLVDVENRAEGDILKAYVKGDDRFYTWELDSTKAWQPKETYKVDESGATVSTKPAAEVNLMAGQSVWVTIKTDETIKLLVTYNPEPVAVEVDTGWNMVAPTTPGGTKVSDIIETLGDAITEKDAIVIPASGNGGAPKIYNKVNGEWGYDDIEYEERTIKGQTVKVAKPFRNTTDTTIKAGRGVWFVNGGDTEKNIDL